MVMNRPEDSNDPYADLRRVSDQLAHLLGPPEQQHQEELDRFFSDEDVKRHLDHNLEAAEAKKRIDTERKKSLGPIGIELVQI